LRKMNKLFVLATLLVVASATVAECIKESAGACSECEKRDTAVCKDTLKAGDLSKVAELEKSISCAALVSCYDKIVDDAKAAEEKKVTDAAATHCPTNKTQCADKVQWCPTWANSGQCAKNPNYMFPNCANSCCDICTGKDLELKAGECPTLEEDEKVGKQCVTNKRSECDSWAQRNVSECTENPTWMRANCMQSCCDSCKFTANGCPATKMSCKNEYGNDDKCSKWAKAGECTSNTKWMTSNCAKACCPVCQAVQPVTTTTLPVYTQPRVQYAQPVRQAVQYQQPVRQAVQYQQPVRQAVNYAQPAFGGYTTGAGSLPRFGGYNFGAGR